MMNDYQDSLVILLGLRDRFPCFCRHSSSKQFYAGMDCIITQHMGPAAKCFSMKHCWPEFQWFHSTSTHPKVHHRSTTTELSIVGWLAFFKLKKPAKLWVLFMHTEISKYKEKEVFLVHTKSAWDQKKNSKDLKSIKLAGEACLGDKQWWWWRKVSSSSFVSEFPRGMWLGDAKNKMAH